jgi:peroxiredoxin
VELQNNYEQIAAQNAEVVAVSTDNLDGAKWAIESLGVPFKVLYDITADVPKAYEVWNLYGDGLATGSAFVIDTNGLVRWKQIYSGVHDLVTAANIVEALKAL